jgi:TetR/AcrR family transcriptional repressor of nem operon
MGHSRSAKADTHKRIVGIAARRLREEGMAKVGVADVMQEAGLTVGGFYKHFESRDDLICEALNAAFDALRARRDAASSGAPPLTYQAMVHEYLTPGHRDNPGDGCPISAVAAEVARADDRTRALFSARLDENLDTIAALIPGKDRRAARAKAILTVSALSGAITLARIVADEAMSREIMKSVADLLEDL